METWGELFWDAWIRLRLACRRLYRTYWPPQFKAWQIYTVTGVASIVLTVLVLRNMPQTAAAGNTQAKANTKKTSQKKSTLAKAKSEVKVPATDEADPFADAQLASNSNDVLVDAVASLPSQPESLETPSDQPLAQQTVPDQDSTTLDATTEAGSVASGKVAAKTVSDDTGEADFGGNVASRRVPVDDPANDSQDFQPAASEQPAADEQTAAAEQPAAAEANEPTGTDLPAADNTTFDNAGSGETASEPAAKAAGPALVVPKRDPDHYLRGTHEDHETAEQPQNAVKATRLKDAPPPVRHTPFVTPVRPKGHYAGFGEAEDAEEERHSVREIRATRTDNVAFPGAKVGNVAVQSQPPATEQPAAPAQDEVPVTPAPAARVQENTPADTPAVEETPANSENDTVPNDFDMPVEQTTEQAPVQQADKPVEQPFENQSEPVAAPVTQPAETESTVTAPVAEEPADEGPMPPVLFSPEPARESAPAATAPPRADYHGPVNSTKASDHEAHQEEDAFSTGSNRGAIKSRVIDHPVTPAGPAENEQVPADNSVEQPETNPVEKTQNEVPVQQPVEAEPVAPPRVPTRAAPPIVIPSANEAQPATENPHLEEDRVIPMAVPDAVKPERIRIPDRLPPEESDNPAPGQESGFTAAIPAAPQPAVTKLVMEITGPKQVPLGTQAIMHFKVQNIGSLPAMNVVVSDVLPAGMQHRLSSELEYVINRLEPGESKETNLLVQCVALGTITNKASLKALGDVTAEAEFSVEVVKASARRGNVPAPPMESPLVMRHHGPERWLVDSTGQFLITVTNPSNQTLQNVTITQSYPQGTSLVHATVGNKIDEKANTVSWTISEFGPGVSYILETELHSMTAGPTTSVARIKIGNQQVAEDRWTAVSYGGLASKQSPQIK